mmetsp:Transcript_67274/g.122728  ORF Transcript_67274/g.122728 Transcript_67274/m.122728 type:complete len:164 (+) Transcript_67274:123-614(+)
MAPKKKQAAARASGPVGPAALFKAWLDGLPTGAPSALLFVAWVLVFRWSGFDQVFFIVSIMALIFFNLGTRSSDKPSAYSVFNSGSKHLLGDLRAEQIDAEHRGDAHLAAYRDSEQNLIDLPGAPGGEDPASMRSRDANRPCKCGSGKKSKKCCFAVRPSGGR